MLWGITMVLVHLRRWGGILFHGETGFPGTLMGSPLWGDGSVLPAAFKLSLGKASLEFGSALDVQAEKCVAVLSATTLSEGNTVLYQFPQCGTQLACGPCQDGSCSSTRVFEICIFCLIVPEVLLPVQYPVA